MNKLYTAVYADTGEPLLQPTGGRFRMNYVTVGTKDQVYAGIEYARDMARRYFLDMYAEFERRGLAVAEAKFEVVK